MTLVLSTLENYKIFDYAYVKSYLPYFAVYIYIYIYILQIWWRFGDDVVFCTITVNVIWLCWLKAFIHSLWMLHDSEGIRQDSFGMFLRTAILVIRRYINITSSTINVCWLNPRSVLFSNNCTSSCLPLPGCCLGSHIWLFNTNRLGIIFYRGETVEAIGQIVHAVADWYQHDICDYSRENLGYYNGTRLFISPHRNFVCGFKQLDNALAACNI